jgi:RNA polymerase sigma factor (sigma-70 family)
VSTSGDTYSEAFPRLQRVASLQAHRILRDRGEADDVVQDALLRAYVAWDGITGYDEAWVGRVAINLAISRLRRGPAPVLAPLEAGEPGPSVDMRLDVARAVELLPRRQRQVVVLRYVADLPLQAVADLLEISTGSVKRHLHRALSTLRDPGAGLSGTYGNEPPEEELMSTSTDWRTRFRPAVEPSGGWPAGPWDHRWFEADGDQVQRLACDHQTGEPLLDADGDEVRTGPGMDFVLVKAERTLSRAFTPWEPDVPAAPLHRLDGSAHEVLDHARRLAEAFADQTVGVTYIAMALLELVPEAGEALGIDAAGFRRAVAARCDGPHADARVDLVAHRLATGWSTPPTARSMPMGMNADTVAWLTEAVRRVDYFDGLLPEEEPTLMVRSVDLLHLMSDPAPRYFFVRELIREGWATRTFP